MSGVKSVFPIPKSKIRIPHSAFRFPHSYSLSILNRYFVGLLRWLLGQSYLQQTVLIGGRYYFRINGCRQKENPFKAAVLYFSKSIGGIAGAMSGETVSLYPDGFAADFNLQVIFVDARNLGYNNDLFRCLIHIHGRSPCPFSKCKARAHRSEHIFDCLFKFGTNMTEII